MLRSRRGTADAFAIRKQLKMTLGAIRRFAQGYWVSLAVIALLAIGLVALVASQRSSDNWRTGQLRSQERFNHHLRMIEIRATTANAGALAQQAASDRQAAADASAGASTATAVSDRGATRVGGAATAPGTSPPSSSSVSSWQPTRFPGPLASGSYVDCASVGHVVSVDDPSRDLETLDSPWLQSKFPSVDLTSVSVAVAGDTLCVDFRAKAPPNPATFYIFNLERPNSTNAFGMQVVFGPHGERAVALQYPGWDEPPAYGIVPGHVGVSGNSTSLLIDRREFPSWVPSPPWWWTGEGVAFTGLSSPQQVSDTDPAGRAVSYP